MAQSVFQGSTQIATYRPTLAYGQGHGQSEANKAFPQLRGHVVNIGGMHLHKSPYLLEIPIEPSPNKTRG